MESKLKGHILIGPVDVEETKLVAEMTKNMVKQKYFVGLEI